MPETLKKTLKGALIHLAFVPRLRLGAAAVGDVLVLGLDFSHNGVHVQVAAVVHLHDDRSVLDLSLELTKLLKKYKERDW